MAAFEYNYEIETIIKQFVAMLNGALIMRYDVDEKTLERKLIQTIQPQYICAPKQRIIYDLVNKAKNYALPCIVISLTGISIAPERISAKYTMRDKIFDQTLIGYSFPTPVTLNFDVTIIAKYITDLYQIYAKFCSHFQRELVFSWFVPHGEIDENQWEELTSKVEWNGDIAFNLQIEKKESDEDKYTGKMTFKVDGWIFPDLMSCNGNIIIDIGTTNYIPDYLNNSILDVSSMKPLVSDVMKDKNYPAYLNPREWANGHPFITNIFETYTVNRKFVYFYVDHRRVRPLSKLNKVMFTIDGYNLSHVDVLFIPCDTLGTGTTHEKITYDYSNDNIFPKRGTLERKNSIVSGYKMNVISQSENKITFNFDGIDYRGNFDIAIADTYDYDLFSDKLGEFLSIGIFT